MGELTQTMMKRSAAGDLRWTITQGKEVSGVHVDYLSISKYSVSPPNSSKRQVKSITWSCCS